MPYDPADAMLLMAGPPERLGDTVLSLRPERLAYRHGPAFPTVQELVAHLAGSSAAIEGVLRGALEGSGEVAISAALGARTTADVSEAVAALVDSYAASRRRTLEMLRSLEPDAWGRTFTDAELGEMTLLDACTRVADHDLAHVSQARNLVSLLPEDWVAAS